ncbi:MAG: Na+/H+ antiporter NhaA [Deltaproteobacteria bacterium]|nr:Na+/H+ antiporter NhaA [Deltaproteobacteria bacterium]MDQ3294989.1 Na+/H+ antiporter NhaA [Myxococcota bacterium]
MSLSDNTHPPGTWAPVRRAAARIASPIQRILAIEAASGIVLLVATVIALTWANLWTGSYHDLWHTPMGGRLGPWSFEQPLHFWVNDGLMTIFFFVVGLEIRREIFEGELATLRKAALPLAAAVGGMLIPAGIFVAMNYGRAGSAGWAVPMATDIAFAVGVLTLLGSRVAPPLRVLLLALAVIDDIGAIVVIAIFYSTGIALEGLAIVGAGIGGVLMLRAAGVRTVLIYVIPGLVVWAGFLVTGIHPTIGGVILGMLAPVRPWFGPSGFAAATQEQLAGLEPNDRGALLVSLDLIEQARREAISPVERLIHSLHPWVAFVVMPVFALANAGVVLGGASLSGDSFWLFAGIVAGLALGKPLGIAAAALGASKVGIATRSSDMTRRGILLVGLVGGIGFTMSLFIAQLAFPPGPLLDTAKLAILVGSGVAIVVGLVFGLATNHKPDRDVSA